MASDDLECASYVALNCPNVKLVNFWFPATGPTNYHVATLCSVLMQLQTHNIAYVFHMISVIRRPLYTHRPEFVIYETFLSPCGIKPETIANQVVGTILYLPVLSIFLIKKVSIAIVCPLSDCLL